MSVSIQRIKSQPELLSTLGFTSFVKSFGLSIENILNPLEKGQGEKQKFEEDPEMSQPTLNSITLDNVHQYAVLSSCYGIEKLSNQFNPSTLLQSQKALNSMLSGQTVSLQQQIENHKVRNLTIVWLSQAYHRARVNSQVFHSSVCLFDKYLSLKSVNQKDCQKIALTCLWMSAKFENTKKYSLGSFTHLLSQPVKQLEIIDIEEDILSTLNFNLCFPTGISFLQIMSTFLHIQKRTFALAFYILELSMFECKYLNYKKSLISQASLYLALLINEPRSTQQKDKIMNLISTSYERLNEITKMLLRNLIFNQDTQYSAVNKKFRTEYFFEVSKIKFMNSRKNQ